MILSLGRTVLLVTCLILCTSEVHGHVYAMHKSSTTIQKAAVDRELGIYLSSIHTVVSWKSDNSKSKDNIGGTQ